MPDLLNGMLDTLTRADPAILLLITGLFMAAETSALIGMAVPGDTVMLLAATTVTTPARFAVLVGIGTLGSLTGETIGYLLGRGFRDRLRHSSLGKRLGERNWTRAEVFLNGGGGRAVAAARFVAVVHAVLPLAAGSMRMPYRRFIGWSATGAVAWSLLYTGIGAVAGASWRAYGDRLGMAGWMLLGTLAGGLVLAWVIWRRRRPVAEPAPARRR